MVQPSNMYPDLPERQTNQLQGFNKIKKMQKNAANDQMVDASYSNVREHIKEYPEVTGELLSKIITFTEKSRENVKASGDFDLNKETKFDDELLNVFVRHLHEDS